MSVVLQGASVKPLKASWPPKPDSNSTVRPCSRSWGGEIRSRPHSRRTGQSRAGFTDTAWQSLTFAMLHVAFLCRRLQAQREIRKHQVEVEKLQRLLTSTHSKSNRAVRTHHFFNRCIHIHTLYNQSEDTGRVLLFLINLIRNLHIFFLYFLDEVAHIFSLFMSGNIYIHL